MLQTTVDRIELLGGSLRRTYDTTHWFVLTFVWVLFGLFIRVYFGLLLGGASTCFLHGIIYVRGGDDRVRASLWLTMLQIVIDELQIQKYGVAGVPPIEDLVYPLIFFGGSSIVYAIYISLVKLASMNCFMQLRGRIDECSQRSKDRLFGFAFLLVFTSITCYFTWSSVVAFSSKIPGYIFTVIGFCSYILYVIMEGSYQAFDMTITTLLPYLGLLLEKLTYLASPAAAAWVFHVNKIFLEYRQVAYVAVLCSIIALKRAETTCESCLEAFYIGKGITCAPNEGHFLCKYCFIRRIQSVVQNQSRSLKAQGGLMCHHPGCNNSIHLQSVASATPRKTFDDLLALYRNLNIATGQGLAATAPSHADTEQTVIERLANEIEATVLTLTCPEGHAYFVFDGCLALRCHCGVYFCGCCHSRSRDNSSNHTHVRACSENPRKNLFAENDEALKAMQTRIKRRKLRSFLNENALTQQQIRNLHQRLSRSLEGEGLEDLFQ